MKIGIDLGGTKTEGILIDSSGSELTRKRINTEKNYQGTMDGIVSLIKEFENDFKTIVSGKYSNKIDIEFAFQELNNVPIGFVCPDNRIKPWGTGHAVLSGSKFINAFFARYFRGHFIRIC